MIETKPPKEKHEQRMDVRLRDELPRSLTPSGWLSPLANAPAAARNIVIHVERIATEANRALQSPRVKIPPIWWSFIAFVALPAFAVTVYFAFIASDQYSVESRFAVRSVEAETEQKGDSASSFSFTASGQNAYIVTSYIRSRTIVEDVSSKLKLREIFRRPEADILARLPRRASIDELTEYWKSMIDTNVDSTSGIVTLKLRAFRRDDALALGAAVVAASETLVNRISDRARRDATAMAEKEVRRAFESVQAALADLHTFRNAFGMIDPGQTSSEIGRLLIPLMGEKIRLENELFVAGRELSPDAPTVRVLRGQLETAEQHIKELKAKLTNADGGGDTIAGSLAKFEELDIQRQLAERFYKLAQTDLDRAQMRANRQSIYLTVFVPPSLPEESRYPHRLAFSVLAFFGLAIVWGIVVMIYASVEDHRL